LREQRDSTSYVFKDLLVTKAKLDDSTTPTCVSLNKVDDLQLALGCRNGTVKIFDMRWTNEAIVNLGVDDLKYDCRGRGLEDARVTGLDWSSNGRDLAVNAANDIFVYSPYSDDHGVCLECEEKEEDNKELEIEFGWRDCGPEARLDSLVESFQNNNLQATSGSLGALENEMITRQGATRSTGVTKDNLNPSSSRSSKASTETSQPLQTTEKGNKIQVDLERQDNSQKTSPTDNTHKELLSFSSESNQPKNLIDKDSKPEQVVNNQPSDCIDRLLRMDGIEKKHKARSLSSHQNEVEQHHKSTNNSTTLSLPVERSGNDFFRARHRSCGRNCRALYPIRNFSGHRNKRTTCKQVKFMGEKSRYLVSGSECGHVFAWDRKSNESKPIVAYLADNRVVNSVDCSDYLVATSGIEKNVKIWQPNYSQNQLQDHNYQRLTPEKLASQLELNAKFNLHGKNTVNVPIHYLLLLRNLRLNSRLRLPARNTSNIQD